MNSHTRRAYIACVRVQLSSRSSTTSSVHWSLSTRFARERTRGVYTRKREKRGPTPFQTERNGRLSFLAPSGEGVRRQARILESRGVSPTATRPMPGASPGFCDDWTARTLPLLERGGCHRTGAQLAALGPAAAHGKMSIDIALFDARQRTRFLYEGLAVAWAGWFWTTRGLIDGEGEMMGLIVRAKEQVEFEIQWTMLLGCRMLTAYPFYRENFILLRSILFSTCLSDLVKPSRIDGDQLDELVRFGTVQIKKRVVENVMDFFVHLIVTVFALLWKREMKLS